MTDSGLPPPYAPLDFAAWIEVYLGGRWHTFGPRQQRPLDRGVFSSRTVAMPPMCL
jgi:transglutaminase-like putative cysteine protease